MKNKRYYSLVKNGNAADINIFGDITSWDWSDRDVSSYKLSKQLEELQDVDEINVHINSYGGEVAEGLAIYNSLRKHKAKVRTYCDGFACSIASVIFMAGDERVMSKASLLMIHNAWTYAQGNSEELRKQADDLDKITSASVNAYMSHVNITEKKLKKLMDNETWLTYQEAIEMGFATSIDEEAEEGINQSVKSKLIDMVLQLKPYQEEEDEEEPVEVEDEENNGEEPTNDEPEPSDDEEEEEPNEEETEDEEGKATERLVAFFNAIGKI